MAEVTPTTVNKRDAFELVLISLLAPFSGTRHHSLAIDRSSNLCLFQKFCLNGLFSRIRHRLSSPPAFRTDVLHMVSQTLHLSNSYHCPGAADRNYSRHFR